MEQMLQQMRAQGSQCKAREDEEWQYSLMRGEMASPQVLSEVGMGLALSSSLIAGPIFGTRSLQTKRFLDAEPCRACQARLALLAQSWTRTRRQRRRQQHGSRRKRHRPSSSEQGIRQQRLLPSWQLLKPLQLKLSRLSKQRRGECKRNVA